MPLPPTEEAGAHLCRPSHQCLLPLGHHKGLFSILAKAKGTFGPWQYVLDWRPWRTGLQERRASLQMGRLLGKACSKSLFSHSAIEQQQGWTWPRARGALLVGSGLKGDAGPPLLSYNAAQACKAWDEFYSLDVIYSFYRESILPKWACEQACHEIRLIILSKAVKQISPLCVKTH